MAIIYLIVDK